MAYTNQFLESFTSQISASKLIKNSFEYFSLSLLVLSFQDEGSERDNAVEPNRFDVKEILRSRVNS
jgi:hypothetical protein